ncbi:unnamed protein product [Bemisia tabaci]|uniref:Uncharacterized protein n=1 Tax=Bemisia tabaci TaxID=7038 RepID=A0A9P0A775_BEMTA|nr:unnamed protein product [Bemisia tabaci]
MQRRERYVLTIFFVTSTFVWTTEAGSEQSQNYDDQPIELPPRPRRRKHKETEDLPPIPSEVGGTDEPALNFDAGLWTDDSDGDWEPDLDPKSKAVERCEKRGEIYFPETGLRVLLFRPASKLGHVTCRYSKAALKLMKMQGLKGKDLLIWQYVNYFNPRAGNKYLEKRGLSIRVELPDEKSNDLSKKTAGRTGTFKRDNWEPRKSSKSFRYTQRVSSNASHISGISQVSRVSQAAKSPA